MKCNAKLKAKGGEAKCDLDKKHDGPHQGNLIVNGETVSYVRWTKQHENWDK